MFEINLVILLTWIRTRSGSAYNQFGSTSLQKCIAHQGKVEVGVTNAALVLVILLALALQLQPFKLLNARCRNFLSHGNLTRLDAPDFWPNKKKSLATVTDIYGLIVRSGPLRKC